MRYQDARLRQLLAAQYALGTLQGPARRRFRRLLEHDAALRVELARWEQRLARLHHGLAPVEPGPRLWSGIEGRMGVVPQPARPAGRRSLRLWQGWALAATLSSVVLGQALWREANRAPTLVKERELVQVEAPAPYLALLQPAGPDEGRWLVSIAPEKGLMKISMHGRYAMDRERHSLELWMLDDRGAAHSLGLLPMEGEMEMPVPRDMPMPRKPMLAVSMEPKGGSPTGVPTGPVIVASLALRFS